MDVMPMVERLLALGPQRAMVADLAEGVLGDGRQRIVIAPELIDRINFIREGAFDEVDGAPTLKLLGEVISVDREDIRSRSVITDDIVLRNFLSGQTVSQPKEYIRYAAVGGHAAWLPVGYFARKAGLSRDDVRKLISALPGTSARKRSLLVRIGKKDAARNEFQGAPKGILQKLNAGQMTEPTDVKNAENIAQAVCGLRSSGSFGADDLLGLLQRCLAVIDAGAKSSGLTYVRRAACRIDELFFPLSD
jgi:hypothetical protein